MTSPASYRLCKYLLLPSVRLGVEFYCFIYNNSNNNDNNTTMGKMEVCGFVEMRAAFHRLLLLL